MKNVKILLLLLVLSGVARAEGLLARLVDINDRWAYEPSAWMSVPEGKEIHGERALIQQHLYLVHKELSGRDVSHLNELQILNRKEGLEHLLQYAQRGLFPMNITHQGRRPIFIDHRGVHCAVGYLIKESGHAELSRHISYNMNDAYVLDMNDAGLNEWVSACGFTPEELAWIQPGYFQPIDYEPLKGGVDGPVNIIISDNNAGIYAGGKFDTADGHVAGSFANYFSGFAGFDWMDFNGSSFQGEVYDAIMYHGELYVAGNFYMVDTTYVNSGVVKWDGSKWVVIGDFYTGALVNYVLDLEIYRDTLYAGGFFRSRFDAPEAFTSLAKWDGTQWRGTAASFWGGVNTLHVYNNKLVIGGGFNMNDTAIQNICMLNGNTVEYFDAPVYVQVNDIETLGGELFIATDFYNQSKQDTMGLAVYRKQAWHRLFGPEYGNINYSGGVECLAPYNGLMLLGGDFDIAPLVGNFGKNLGIYRGGSVNAFGMVDSTVRCMTIINDQLFMGGDFNGATTSSGGVTLNHIAQVYLPKYISTKKYEIKAARVYPNPANDKLTVEIANAGKMNITLTDISGKEFPVDCSGKGESYELDVSHLKVGTYILTAETSSGSYQEKIIVQ